MISGVNPGSSSVLVNNTQYKEYKDTLRVDIVNQDGVGSNFKASCIGNKIEFMHGAS